MHALTMPPFAARVLLFYEWASNHSITMPRFS
jgi:hypothetical protein